MFEATQVESGIDRARLRRLFLAGASLMVLAGPALAADLPVAKAPPAVAASWAGFYLGVHGGYGWKQDDFSESTNLQQPPQSINGVRSQGAVYGAQAGYNWQFGRAVTGLEIDFSAANIQGSNGISEAIVIPGVVSAALSDTLSERVRYLGSARARLGWLPMDNVLLYGTAGLAWERLDQTQTLSQVVTPNGQPTQSAFISSRSAIDKFGWVAGVGAEVMLGSPNWIGRIEYLHYDLGHVATATSLTDTTPGSIPDVSTAGSQTIEVVRAGVSYKFGEPARMASAAYAKAPAAAPASSWAGFYLGAHGGYGWGDDPGSLPMTLFFGLTSTDTIGGVKSKGWVGGGQLGHNWQYDRLVTGFEVDLSAADISGRSNVGSGANQGTTVSSGFDEKVKYLGTMRGRLGWLPTDNFLLYGTAGLAWERFERAETDVFTTAAGTTTSRFSAPSDRFGWVAGVGGEAKLGGSNWIGRIEYLHYDFGRINQDGTFNFVQAPITLNAALTAGRQTIDVVRAGVSYKFGPEVAAAAAAPAMYAKAPRMPAPLQSWAGFYLGAHGGYGWKDNDFSTNFFDVAFIGGIKSKGWLVGGQAGYNWQYASVVAGLEIDGSATGIQGSSLPATSLPGSLTETLSDNVKYLGTARGRLGWTPAGSWLLYGTGGLAWERVHRSTVDVTVSGGNTSTFTSDQPFDHFGWVAGAGVEAMIGSSNWIARLEYLHYDFGTVEGTSVVTSTDPATPSLADKGGRQTIETVRAGLSYKFTP